MIVLAVDTNHPDADLIAQAGAILSAGGVVAFPTDTVYGLAADPRQPDAVERLYEVKGRDRGIAIPLIAASLEQAHAAAVFGAAERRLAEAFWPGPLSIIVPATGPVAPALRGHGGTVAIRVPDHAVARALAQALGFPITATSANLSGEPPADSGDALNPELARRLDAVVDVGAAPGGPPSTIVELTTDGPRLVRAGAIAWDRVLTFLQ